MLKKAWLRRYRKNAFDRLRRGAYSAAAEASELPLDE